MKDVSARGAPQTAQAQAEWFQETLHKHYRQSFEVSQSLVSKKTPFQNLQIFHNLLFGNVLVLDGVVQTTENDEFVYHEMLTHVAMMSHPDPRRVLIIGAGDGGVLREVLKHDIEEAVMVEIDGDVIDLSKKHLPKISDGAFDNPRARVLVEDGAKFVAQTKEKFDVVLVDSPDPVGPAKVLFSQEFYKNIKNCLTEEGMVVRQSGAPILQGDILKENYRLMGDVFPTMFLYLAVVPTYIGGFFSFVMGSNSYNPAGFDRGISTRRYEKLNPKTKYYNPEIHRAAFVLPNHIKNLIF